MPTRTAARTKTLADLANVGPATLADFRTLKIGSVARLARQDAMQLYERLCRKTGVRHDPCVIDVFMATIEESRGARPQAWWKFTARRKRLLAAAGGGKPKARKDAAKARKDAAKPRATRT